MLDRFSNFLVFIYNFRPTHPSITQIRAVSSFFFFKVLFSSSFPSFFPFTHLPAVAAGPVTGLKTIWQQHRSQHTDEHGNKTSTTED